LSGGPAELFSLAGRTAVITGASRGLGREMALAFAAAGARVVVSSRKLDSCQLVVDEIVATGGQACAVAAHVGRWDTLPGLLDAAEEAFGRVDVLVNNAGSSPLYDKLGDISESLFDSVLSLNLKGPFRLSVLAAERMRERGVGGSIINISSLGATRPEVRALPYAAAKMALDVITVGLAAEFGPSIRVNSIRPGSFATDVSAHWTDAEIDTYTARSALARVAAPREIVGTALYLASDASSFTTGATIAVDGGVA
jgi:NAD(P)-dependent dehydrogenase (short-subunit alcohol dehydrogenase family)